jgi:hypothetical protein
MMDILFKISMFLFGSSVLYFMHHSMKHFDILDRYITKDITLERSVLTQLECSERAFLRHDARIVELETRIKKIEENIRDKTNV